MAKSKSQKQQQQQSGGEGGADYALKVYGGVNDQRPMSQNNNAIAMNATGSAAGPMPSMKGGEGVVTSSFQSLFRRGGNLSKQQLQKTIKKQLKQLRGGELQYSELNNVSGSVPPVAGAQQMAPPVAGLQQQESMITVMKGGNGPEPSQSLFSNVEKAFAQKGGKLSKQQLQSFSQQLDKLQQQQQQQQQGGVGLNEIVVPLLLLYASQKYAQGKNTQKNAKSFSKSVRKSRRFLR